MFTTSRWPKRKVSSYYTLQQKKVLNVASETIPKKRPTSCFESDPEIVLIFSRMNLIFSNGT